MPGPDAGSQCLKGGFEQMNIAQKIVIALPNDSFREFEEFISIKEH